ncbi:MAG: cation:proton antiporter [Bdellovibrionaceae bacterium]|nr:cation:proton antiporter [Pseudobdellovibrionaceae bacterium]MBX3033301.1 cation:proton antiporter [Pseudobdellovibrionaceae bacterium]
MAHLPSLIQDLAVILVTAAIVTLIFRRLRQPVVLGYLMAGVLIGPHTGLLPQVTDRAGLQTWAEIGVIIFLFTLGLEFSFRRLARSGRSAFVTGFVEIPLMMGLGYLTGRSLGWTVTDSLFLGGVLSISSTTIIFKSIEDLGQKNRSFVPLVFGVLIIEDLIAVLLLVLLATVALSKNFSGLDLLTSAGRLGFFLALWTILGTLLLPAFLRKIKKELSDETGLIVGLGLCLLMVVAATQAGFSPALGAFVMGSLLSETLLGPRLQHLVKPVKDLFGAVFFVSMGMLVDPAMVWAKFDVILLLVAVVIFGKILAVTLGALLSGAPVKRSVQTGLCLTQIGEFSFIIAGLAASMQVTRESLPVLAVSVSVITTFTTPWFIRHSDSLAQRFENALPLALRHRLQAYQTSLRDQQSGSLLRLLLRAYGPKILVHTTLIIAIVWVGKHHVLPMVMGMTDPLIASLITLLAVLIAAAPFFWGLVMSSPLTVKLPKLRGMEIGVSTARGLLGAALLAYCVGHFLSALAASGLLLLVLCLGTFFFTRHAEPFYRVFEGRWRESTAKKGFSSPDLAPWDATLTEFILSADSELVGQNLMSAAIKERYGVMVALIERGSRRLLAPGAETLLLPGDRIFLIGTESQITNIAPVLEKTAAPERGDGNYGLQSLVLKEQSPFAGRSIRECGLREKIQGLIIGIEREGNRVLNPDSGLTLKQGDLLWIVGDLELIAGLQR